jgi:hypothetical protein
MLEPALLVNLLRKIFESKNKAEGKTELSKSHLSPV